MQKRLIVLAASLACSSAVWAQSNVTLYGIMDLGVRHTTNEGPAGDSGKSRTAMVGGGMSQSRWGIRGTEDLGNGSKVLFNMEQRVLPQTGAIIGQPSVGFQQAWVAYEHKDFGRITMGRQYNALFDLQSSTFVSYPYSPYFDLFKPEVGFVAAARFNELIKYTANFGKFRFQLEATLRGEQETTISGVPGNTGGKGYGTFLRWADGGLALGASYLERGFGGDGRKLKAFVVGGSYKTGPWYFTTSYGQNKHNLPPQRGAACAADPQCQYDYSVLSSLWAGTSSGGFSGPAFTMANKRQLVNFGLTYQLTPALNIGGHYWYAKQSGSSPDAKAKAHFFSVIADYALSKRSDAYFEVDYTKLKGDQVSLNGSNGAANGAKSRMGVTIGFRHRF